jgi:hypothetical protein
MRKLCGVKNTEGSRCCECFLPNAPATFGTRVPTMMAAYSIHCSLSERKIAGFVVVMVAGVASHYHVQRHISMLVRKAAGVREEGTQTG